MPLWATQVKGSQVIPTLRPSRDRSWNLLLALGHIVERRLLGVLGSLASLMWMIMTSLTGIRLPGLALSGVIQPLLPVRVLRRPVGTCPSSAGSGEYGAQCQIQSQASNE